MKIFEYPKDRKIIREKLAGRKQLYRRELIGAIEDIFSQVEEQRDKAIIDLTEKHDRTRIKEIKLSEAYIDQAVRSISEELKTSSPDS